MHNWKIVLVFLMGLLSLAAPDAAPWQAPATGPSDTLSGQLRISGSSTMAPLLTAIAKRFHALHPAVNIEIQSGGSGRGIADVSQGKTDIGMVSRTLHDAERELNGFPIARDGIAIILHKDNPIQVLSNRQVLDIYTGKVTNWKQLGGRDQPILAVMAEAGRGSYELFAQYFSVRPEAVKAGRVVGDNTARIKLMVDNPNAILYISAGEAARNAMAGVAIKLLPIANVAATSKNIRNGNYPVSRPLTLVTKGLPQGLTKVFMEYSLSSQVTDLVLAHDFVPYLD